MIQLCTIPCSIWPCGHAGTKLAMRIRLRIYKRKYRATMSLTAWQTKCCFFHAFFVRLTRLLFFGDYLGQTVMYLPQLRWRMWRAVRLVTGLILWERFFRTLLRNLIIEWLEGLVGCSIRSCFFYLLNIRYIRKRRRAHKANCLIKLIVRFYPIAKLSL